MSTIRFTKDHEWIRIEGDTGTVGITTYAQEKLGDVVYVEVPETGQALAQGDEAAVVESVKAASEIYAPVDGEVAEGNEAVVDDPALANSDPMGAGWFFKMTVANAAQFDALMDETAYKSYLEELE